MNMFWLAFCCWGRGGVTSRQQSFNVIPWNLLDVCQYVLLTNYNKIQLCDLQYLLPNLASFSLDVPGLKRVQIRSSTIRNGNESRIESRIWIWILGFRIIFFWIQIPVFGSLYPDSKFFCHSNSEPRSRFWIHITIMFFYRMHRYLRINSSLSIFSMVSSKFPPRILRYESRSQGSDSRIHGLKLRIRTFGFFWDSRILFLGSEFSDLKSF